MNLDKIIYDLTLKNVLLISHKVLDDLLTMVIVLKEENTLVNGIIRILKYNNSVIIQELSDKNEIVLRLAESLEGAILFVQKRMETYDKMWDGCGCKINYYE